MFSRKTTIAISLLLATAALCGGVWWLARETHLIDRLPQAERSDAVQREEADRMKAADLAARNRIGVVAVANGSVQPSPYAATKPATVAATATMETKRAALSAKSGLRPERISAVIPAKPFDAKAWNDPQSGYRLSYLSSPEFGRVWQPLPAGDNIPQLAVVGGDFFRLKATSAQSNIPQEVSFVLKGIPDAPVSASCFDGLYFTSTQLGTATTATDKDGQAKFTLEVPAGMAGQVKVMCASPMMSGQVKITLDIKR